MKKGQTHFKWIKPMSNMRLVLSVVEQGNCTRQAITEASGLVPGRVARALHNLSFIGAITIGRDAFGRFQYFIPGSRVDVAGNLKGVSSIFAVTTNFDNGGRGRSQHTGAYGQKD